MKVQEVWEACAKGEQIESLLAGYKEPQHKMALSFVDYFLDEFASRSAWVKNVFDNRPQTTNRSALAEYINKYPPKYSAALWAMVDGNDWHKIIWVMLKPTA